MNTIQWATRDFIMERVRNGAAYLDRECPDWRSRINLQEFQISNHLKCIIGQLFGNYFTYQRDHELTDQQMVHMGFAGGIYMDHRYGWDDLEDAWRTFLS